MTVHPRGWSSSVCDSAPQQAAPPLGMSGPQANQPHGKNSLMRTRSRLQWSPHSTEECLGYLCLLPLRPLRHAMNMMMRLATCVDCCYCRDEAIENCNFPHTKTAQQLSLSLEYFADLLLDHVKIY